MELPFLAGAARRRVRAALEPALQVRLAALRRRNSGWLRGRALRAQPLARARVVAIDLETTGPRMDRDRLIAIGAIAAVECAIVHADAFAAVVRQAESSSHENILVHCIGGQQQLSGRPPAEALLDFLEYRGGDVAIAFRAEFDATVLARALALDLGIRLPPRILDLAQLLPAFFPGTPNDRLDEWLDHFGLPMIRRHEALADAYAAAQLWLVLLAAAQRSGARTIGDLMDVEAAQRWLGRRR